jgi:hypothetical protein
MMKLTLAVMFTAIAVVTAAPQSPPPGHGAVDEGPVHRGAARIGGHRPEYSWQRDVRDHCGLSAVEGHRPAKHGSPEAGADKGN